MQPLKLPLVKSSNILQEQRCKKWFKRHSSFTKHHYQMTATQVQTENHIGKMFKHLDTDGGGTLSMAEIQSLFQDNGIDVSKKEVHKMFEQAQTQHYLQKSKSGNLPVIAQVECKRKSLNPNQFTIVVSSQSSLRKVQQNLKVLRKRSSSYVPVTMDELMSSFLKSIHRDEMNKALQNAQKVLEQPDLMQTHNLQIEGSVRDSFRAIGQMMAQPVTERDRQPNCENNLYLKLLAKVTKKENLQLVRMDTQEKCQVIRKIQYNF